MPTVNRSPFQYLIIIEPLGLLYGSAGRFLSPENLVGRSGTSFPPSATVLSGLFAAYDAQQEPDKAKQKEKRSTYQFAGPFWAWSENIQNFFVPTPFNCLVEDGKQQIEYRMVWCEDKWQVNINGKWDKPPNEKFRKGTWLNIADWHILQRNNSNTKPQTHNAPWQPVTHLHPKLKLDERRVDEESTGSLFLENAMQLDPDACLVYLWVKVLP
jgi:CRISPR-associated protein Cmr3